LMLADVFGQVLVAMSRSCLANGKGILPDDLLGSMSDELASLGAIGKQIKGIGGETLQSVKSLAGEADKLGGAAKEGFEKGKDAAQKTVDGLKGLIPKKK
jgi:uncharacterized protein YjbJ (UPF0337 family)